MTAAKRIACHLKAVCEAQLVLSPGMTKEGWRARQAERLGVSESTFDNWFFGDNPPNAENLINLAQIYGPDLINAYIEPLGYLVYQGEEARGVQQSGPIPIKGRGQ